MREPAPKPVPMSLTRYSNRTLTIPIIFMLCAFVAFQIYEDHTYKGEWIKAEAFLPIELVMVIVHCAIVSCLCVPILMNKRPDVRGNFVRSF
jgi:hypothetical protein